MSEHEQEGEEQEEEREPEPWESFIIQPSLVEELWRSARPKEALIDHYSKHFNPEGNVDEDQMDYNELNIIAEFQIYNLVFAKELLLDDTQISYLLEVFF
jgi:hypothetical protein